MSEQFKYSLEALKGDIVLACIEQFELETGEFTPAGIFARLVKRIEVPVRRMRVLAGDSEIDS